MALAYLIGKKRIFNQPPLIEDGLVYGVKIDTLNPNPSTAITYIDDSIGFTSARGNNGNFDFGSWENRFPFNSIKPCLFKDGEVVGYLNKNNYSVFENGLPSNIINSSSGDTMIEFPKVYYKIERIANDIFVKYSKTQIDSTFKALAHTNSSQEEVDKIYIGAFVSNISNSVAYSISGVTPTGSMNISSFRNSVEAKGSRYAIMNHNQLTLLQLLFLIMFKSRDSLTLFGQGKTSSGISTTGETNGRGLFYATDSNTTQNKFCGLESFYGNMFQLIDGVMLNSEKRIIINGVDMGYQDSLTGVMTDIQGTTEKGFIPRTSDTLLNVGSNYYNSLATLTAGRVFQFGAGSAIGSQSGAFRYTADVLPTATANNRGVRMVYV